MNKNQSAMVRRTVSNQLQNRAHFPDSIEGLARYADILIDSGLVPKAHQMRDRDGTRARIVVITQFGAAVGLDPTTSLWSVDVIEGKPTLNSKARLALAQRHPAWDGIRYELNRENRSATVIVSRKGMDDVSYTYTWQDAKTAGLADKFNWKKHPMRMLLHRARTYALEDTFADALGALPSTEDIQAERGEEIEWSPEDAKVNAHADALDAEYEDLPHNPETGEVAPQSVPEPEPTPEEGGVSVEVSEAKIAFLVAFGEAETPTELQQAKETTKQAFDFDRLPRVTQGEIVAAYKKRSRELLA